MTATPAAGAQTHARPRHDELDRRLILAALVVTVLALLHHVDHVVRGDLVVDEALPDEWNHSGWPFWNGFTPFTASLGVYAILLGGVVLTLVRRVSARYWIGASILLFAIVVFVHFLGSEAETPRVIWRTYDGGARGALALIDLFALLAALVFLGVQAILARRATNSSSISMRSRQQSRNSSP